MNDPKALARLVTPEERELAITRLSDAFARDVLALDEFERRVAEAYRAQTQIELAETTRDLPESPAAASSLAPARPLARQIKAFLSNVEQGGPLAVPERLVVRALLGNVELDLRGAEFMSQITEIEIRSVLGNVELSLPADVAVENHGDALLGSFVVRTASSAAPSAVVRVVGRALMGNVEIT
jgi:hypothetical protein